MDKYSKVHDICDHLTDLIDAAKRENLPTAALEDSVRLVWNWHVAMQNLDPKLRYAEGQDINT